MYIFLFFRKSKNREIHPDQEEQNVTTLAIVPEKQEMLLGVDDQKSAPHSVTSMPENFLSVNLQTNSKPKSIFSQKQEVFAVDLSTKTVSERIVCEATTAISELFSQTCSSSTHTSQSSVSLTVCTPLPSDSKITSQCCQETSNFQNPFGYSTPHAWSSNESENKDPIQFLTQAPFSSNLPYQMNLNPPLPQRLSSLHNPLPFPGPCYDNLVPYTAFPFVSDFNYSMNYYDYSSSYGYDGTPGATNRNVQSGNDFNFQNGIASIPENNNAYNTSQQLENNLQSDYAQPQNDSTCHPPSASKNVQLKTKRLKPQTFEPSLWLYILRGAPGSGKSTLARKLRGKL